jgi:O-antigen/teichoic acid export membrane protein
LEHCRAPLFRNGYALLLSGATTAGLGLLYWLLAARLYPPVAVGVGAALLSAMLLLAGMAQLSLNNVLIRFVPVAGAQARRLVGYAYLASTLAAAGLTLVFVLGVEVWAPALNFLKVRPAWALAFGAAVTAWCIFALQDSVLTGLRQTLWVPAENAAFAAGKVVLVVAFAGWASQAGIFLSWLLPAILAVVLINLLLWGRLLTPAGVPFSTPEHTPLTRREVIGFASGNYLGTLLLLAQTSLLPLMVTARAGPEAAAYFFLPWTIAGGLQLVVTHLSTSLTVEASMDQRALHAYGKRVLKQSLRLLLPLVAGLGLGGPWLLAVFGPGYAAEGVSLLRWLAVACLPNVVVVLALCLARVQNRPSMVAVIQGAACLPALALSFAWLPAHGIVAVGWAWLANQAAIACVLLLTLMKPVVLWKERGSAC